MKKLLFLLAVAMCAVAAYAIPAFPGLVKVTQPDGTELTIKGHGDEFFHFITTADGYTIMQDARGYWTYAQRDAQGTLKASTVVARDAAKRTPAEQAMLAQIGTNLTDAPALRAGKARRAERDADLKKVQTVDYSKFRGLVVLIDFPDRKFSRNDIVSVYTDMFNKENYKGYTTENGGYDRYGSMFIGSVRDYFHENSNGIFTPQFDVVGPVTIDIPSDSVEVNSNFYSVFYSALQAVNDQVDFTKYDADGNGQVDMVYFICAGYGSNYSGNNSGYLWPHQSSLSWTRLRLDGMTFGRYSSSIELYGWESQGRIILDGIGVVCHEFSHTLGLPDLYDTDYATNGQSHDPGQWDVMAGSSYTNYSRLPSGYTAFERYALGWQTPKEIADTGTYTLQSTQTSQDSYILRTPQDGEYFIFDNRQKTRWDAGLPGHGMLVARVDSTDLSIWQNNKVNANPSHNYFELLRAGGSTEGAATSDPFPGTAGVTELSATTTPAALKTWAGLATNYAFSNIQENNGVITFEVRTLGDQATQVEDFETMAVTSSTSLKGVQGRFAKWDFTRANVQAPSDTTLRRDAQSVRLRLPSAVSMTTPVTFRPYQATLEVLNGSGATVKLKLAMKSPGDSTWTDVNDAERTIDPYAKTMVTWTVSAPESALFRIQETAGAANNACYIDNFTLYYYKTGDDPKPLRGDVNQDGVVNVNDVTTLVNMMLNVITPNLETADIDGNGSLNVTDVTELVGIILANK